MSRPRHVELRKKISKVFHKILSTLMPMNRHPEPIRREEIQRILVVRINYRIGNILFTTPLLNALEKAFPNATIDMIVGAPFTIPLIEGMPQVNKVYAFPRKLLKQPLQVLKFKKELKNNNYDLLIAPNLKSTSDTLFTFLVNSRYKLGFYAEDVFSPLTHATTLLEGVTHEALKPLVLMSELTDAPYESHLPYLDIRLSDEEINSVKENVPSNAIGIFRDARGKKKIEESWWLTLLDALHKLAPQVKFVDILDPDNQTAIREDIPTLSQKNLRVLAAHIANLDAFICGDTGPMHLASSVKTPTVALFKATSPTKYGTLGEQDLSLVMKDKSVDEIAKEILVHLDIISA